MKFTTTIEKLRDGITLVERVSGKNTALPILGSLLMSVRDDKLTLRATNLHVGVEYTLSVKGLQDGSCAVPAATIKNILQSLQQQDVADIALEDTALRIETRQAAMKLAIESAEEFPTLPQTVDADVVTVPADALVQGIRSTVFAASPSDIKPEIASVYVYADGDTLVCVATDTFRLAEKRIVLKKPVPSFQVLIPAKNALELVRLLQDIDGELELHIGSHQLSMYADGMYCTSRVVEGIFPDYRQILPKEWSTELKALKDELIATLRVTDIFANKFHEISLSIQPQEGICTVRSKDAAIGEQEYRLQATITGDPTEIHINQRYLAECMPFLVGESIVFQLTQNRPLIVRSSGDQSFLYLIMPMNR